MSRSRLDAALHRAAGLVDGVAEEGDRLATCLPNSQASFALSWAMALAGVVEVPVPPGASEDEAGRLLADAGPRALLLHTEAPTVHRAATGIGVPVHTELDAAPVAPGADAPRTRPMSYTSGTTGRRKGVYAGVHDATWGRAWLDDERAAFEGRHGPRHLVVSPLYHSGPLRHALVCADGGGDVEVLARFDVDRWLQALRSWRPTSMFCVPTHLHRLLAHPDLRPDDLASLRLLVHAGAPCPTRLKERLHGLAPEGAVWEFYGSTEGQFTICPPWLWAEAPGTVGVARPGRRVEVRDEAGAAVPTGVTGQVWASAPDHARWEYWRQPTATAAAWEGDAFTVDDLGHLDEVGRLLLDGRAGDLVVTGGVNVYPAEVEQVLRQFDGVEDAAVFGMPDEEWGQRLVAVVVPDRTGPPPSPPQLLVAARERLSPARVPRQLVLVEELPRTPTGKVRRLDLPGLLP